MVSFKKSLMTVGVALTLGLAITPSHPVFAGSATLDPACDTSFLSAMQDKAWMEAQRETMIAETIIAKPDSVFALTCFSKDMSDMGTLTKLTISGDTSLTTIGNSVNSYVSAAFPHALGGGHSSSAGTNSTSNACNTMSKLWSVAQCSDVPGSSSIPTLAALIGGSEPRTFPSASCSGSSSAWTTPKTTLTTTGVVTGAGGFDAMKLFSGITAPYSQTAPSGGSPKCSAPIKTGIVIGSDPEVVCANPGCSPTGGGTPKCCPTGTTSGSGCS